MTRGAVFTALIAFGLSLLVSGAAALVTGPTLGLFIGGLGGLLMVVPPLASGRHPLATMIGATSAMICVWAATAWGTGGFSLLDLTGPILCGLAVAAAVAGTTVALCAIGLPPAVAQQCVLVVGCVWLSWPVPLTSWLHQIEPAVDTMVALHPAFAINGSIESLPPWTEMPMMYRLTVLGQDVPYRMPRTVWPCVLTHTAIGLVGFGLRWWVESRRPRSLELPSVGSSAS